MRITKRKVVLVVFLLSLYIVPLLFTSSSHISTTRTEPNMTKEFQTSDYLDESTESITRFSETLDDDVFYTPDGWYDDTIVLAFDGYGDWADTLENDSVYWSSFDVFWEYIEFLGSYAIEGFEYSVFGKSVNDIGNLSVYDTMTQDFQTLFSFTTSYAWHNGTYWGTNYEPSRVEMICQIGTEGVSASKYISIDYIELRFHYLPLYDYSYANGFTNWGESFSNVSDWSGYGTEAGDSISTDGDIGTIVYHDDDNSDWWQYDFSDSIRTNYYFEIRYAYNTTAYGSSCSIGLVKGGLMGSGGSISQTRSLTASSSYVTLKEIITSIDTITAIAFYMGDTAGDYSVSVDYLRISPSDEMGFQHDGSTTEGVIGGNGGTLSSDGDILHCVDDGDGSTYKFYIDTTTTLSMLQPNYYQFIELKFSQGNSYFRMDSIDGSDSAATLISYTAQGSNTLYRFNLDAAENQYTKYLQLTSYSYDLYVDYIKVYSIANFTVTQGNADSNDAAYVAGGSLIFPTLTALEWMNLNYDITMTIDPTTYNYWELDTENITYFAFRYSEVGVGWHDKIQAEESGYLTGITGNIADIQIEVEDGGGYISSIIFIDMHHWREIDSVDIILNLPEWHLVDTATILIWLNVSTAFMDFMLVFAGMVLLPVSTGYLAYSIKKRTISFTKFFFFCVLFVLGLGMFLGGFL